ncbi:MAG TPA: protein translocase subunit SecF [Gemmatimonadaceae bacterium]|nr:protein translocase subunit SecF [Gemmatimonadaceae bacterium]
MLRILHDTHYDFIRWWKWAIGLTLAFLVIGLGSLAFKPANYSIEFTGGTLLQVEFTAPADAGRIRSTLEGAGVHGAEIQQFGSNREYTVRAQDAATVQAQAGGAETIANRIEAVLRQEFGADQLRVVRTEAVGPRVGSELRRGAIIAILISFVITLIYLSIRFEWRFAAAAIIATSHDIIGTVAFIALMRLEISLTIVAGLLTVLGYSLNDTIIIFDRARENLRKGRKESLYETLNRSINETLPRSILTHATALASTVALLIFAGEVLRPFAWVMSFGIITGAFSSIYVAAPVLLWIERKWPRKTGARPSSSTATPTSRTRRSPATATP